MPEAGAGRGSSRYRAVRVTLTDSGAGRDAFVSVSVKRHAGGWAEFESLLPAIRAANGGGMDSTKEALEHILMAVSTVIAELG